MSKIIEFKKVTKTFLDGKIVANKDVTFSIEEGTVHAIAGENGAGKSTLLSMLFGLYHATSGEIFVKGKKINYKSAADAMADGLGMVQQHFQLVDKYTVGQNILLGKEKSVFGFVKRKEDYNKINQLSKEYGFGITADQKISTLTVGQEQKTEILKLLFSDSEVFIFDEPTAMLTPTEIEELLKVIKHLKSKGKTIIIITHKLDEIKAVADVVSVIRKGEYIGQITNKELTPEKLSRMMVGRDIETIKKAKTKAGEAKLIVDNATVIKHRITKLKGVSFDVKAGEILAVAGVEGNGQTELANSILGLDKLTSGSIKVNLENHKNSINKLSISKRNKIIANVPEDRHKYGMVLDATVYENMALKNFSENYTVFGFIQRKKMQRDARRVLEQFDVRGANRGMAVARGLSGGNQQKAVVGREIAAKKDIMIIFQATRGLDVGAIDYIHRQILHAKEEGKAILLISYDVNEVIKLADRVIVLNSGRVTGELDGKDINKSNLGILMSKKEGGK